MIQMGNKITFIQDGRVMTMTLTDREMRTKDDYYRYVTAGSPVGQALTGKKPGDRFEVKTPGGLSLIKVLEVE